MAFLRELENALFEDNLGIACAHLCSARLSPSTPESKDDVAEWRTSQTGRGVRSLRASNAQCQLKAMRVQVHSYVSTNHSRQIWVPLIDTSSTP